MRGVSRPLLAGGSDGVTPEEGGATERGATLALVALTLVGMLIVAALVIDIGSGWLIRQNLVPATDAAALAAAQQLVERPWDTAGACATAELFLVDNAPAAALTGCEVVAPGPDGGRVAITATEAAGALLAPDGEDRATTSTSAAAWGSPLAVSGLRPLAFCYDGSPELQQLLDEPPTGPTWVAVSFVKHDPSACGGQSSSGSFLTVDFEGGTDGHEVRHWMRDGYPDHVSLDTTPASSCGGDTVCHQRPYALLDLYWELQSLRNSREYVALPVYDYADADQVHLVGVVRARIYAFGLDGPPEHWWFQLKVDPGLVAGTCCGPAAGGATTSGGNRAIALCAVDQGGYAACDAGSSS
jgi:Flp pilus assembly protein TadG